MPLYDYFCPANHQTVTVRHSMSLKLSTWGELCATAGLEPGETPGDAAVERLLAGGMVLTAKSWASHSGNGCCGVPGCSSSGS